TRYRTR
ncbi:hypothetical protein ECNE1487_2025, partial [Escherichia coli NE1487]